jgi:hypothetical protein
MKLNEPWGLYVFIALLSVLSVAVAVRMPQTPLAWGILGAGIGAACWPFASPQRRKWWLVPLLSGCYAIGFYIWSTFISTPKSREVFGEIGFVVLGVLAPTLWILTLAVKRFLKKG